MLIHDVSGSYLLSGSSGAPLCLPPEPETCPTDYTNSRAALLGANAHAER